MSISKAISFQELTLAWLAQEPVAVGQIRSEVPTSFWQNPTHQGVASAIYEYFDEFEGTPSESALRAIVEDTLSSSDVEMAKYIEYDDLITKLFHEHLKDESEKTFLKKSLESFIRKRLVDMSLLNGATLSGQGEFDQASAGVTEAANFKLNKDVRHVRWSTFNRTEYMQSAKTAPVSTGFPSMDAEMHGGLHPGEVGIICGVAGTGKSQMLVNLAVNAIAQGKHVLFITNEMHERDILRRADACMSGEDYWAIMDSVTANAMVQARVQADFDEHHGDMDVRYFEPHGVTVPELRALIKKWYPDKLPDLIIIDYADQFRPTVDYKNGYDNQGLVYTQIVAMAGTLERPIWTASQANRDGKKAKTIQLEHLADSWKKACVAHVVYTINQDEHEVKGGLLRLYSVKMRNGEKNRFHYFKTEFKKAKLTPTSDEVYATFVNSPDYGGGGEIMKIGKQKTWTAAAMMSHLKTS